MYNPASKDNINITGENLHATISTLNEELSNHQVGY